MEGRLQSTKERSVRDSATITLETQRFSKIFHIYQGGKLFMVNDKVMLVVGPNENQ